jgi:hypothetical protein
VARFLNKPPDFSGARVRSREWSDKSRDAKQKSDYLVFKTSPQKVLKQMISLTSETMWELCNSSKHLALMESICSKRRTARSLKASGQ